MLSHFSSSQMLELLYWLWPPIEFAIRVVLRLGLGRPVNLSLALSVEWFLNIGMLWLHSVGFGFESYNLVATTKVSSESPATTFSPLPLMLDLL
jgi:hypothetical protein